MSLTHLDKRMLFIHYSSVFNTIDPSKLETKLRALGLDTTLCNWILTGRPQAVRIGNNTSSTLTHNTGEPQGCVLSPLLYSLFTQDCVALHDTNSIVKFADNTSVVVLITNDESAYREEISALELWCQDNLSLKVGNKPSDC
jgi:hypothetical protein